jgi:RecJ-like exonuclease
MSDNRDDADQTPDEAGYFFDSRGDAPGDAADCPACGGTGKVALLVTTRRCEECGGSGKIAEDAPGEPFDESGKPVAGHWVTESTFDQQGRVARERQWFVPDRRKPKA